jgi:hypothetical protein
MLAVIVGAPTAAIAAGAMTTGELPMGMRPCYFLLRNRNYAHVSMVRRPTNILPNRKLCTQIIRGIGCTSGPKEAAR